MSINSLSGLSGLPSLSIFDTEIKNQKTPLANMAKDPQVKADIAYFTTQIAKLKTPDDFLNNPKLVNFVLTAFGLQTESSAMGIVKQVLTQDPTSSKSLANKLADPRWQKLATAIDFFHRGVAGLQAYTSTTSAKIQSGGVSLTLNTAPNFKLGQQITFADTANPHQNFMTGSVTKINGSSVTINVPAGLGTIGAGTINKWTVFANNAKTGGTTTQPSQVVQNIVQQYTTAQFENSLGQQSTPAEEAAYFLRNSNSVTSVYQLLGDRVMLDVIEGALGLPKNIAVQPIADQARLLQSQLDITKLQNPNAKSFASASADQTTLQGVNQVTAAAQSAVSNVVGKLKSIMQQYTFLPGRTDPAGSNAATIAIQQASVAPLAQASGLIGAANNALSSVKTAITTLNQLVAAAPTASSTTLAADKTQFQQLTQQIQSYLANATYTNPANGAVDNLLTSSSLSVSATVKAGETLIFTGLGLNTTTLASQLNAANTAFQSTTVGGPVNPTVSTNLSSVSTTTSSAQTQVTSELRTWNQGIQDSGPFLATLSSGALNTGLAAGKDAQSRVTTVNSLVQQLQDLATQSASTSFTGNRTTLNTQAQSLITQINATIGTPGTGVADNLLTQSKSYSLIGSNSLTIRNAGLDVSVSNNLTTADISTQSGAQSLSNLITNSLQPSITTAQIQLSADVNAVNTTINTMDPRAVIDAQLKQLVSSMPSIETGAGANGQNLISTAAKSIAVTIKTTSDTFTVHGHANFDSLVTGALNKAVAALATSNSPPTAFLQQAFGAATTIQSSINTDVANLARDQSKVSALVNQQAKQDAANLTNPYAGATSAAQSLVQRYLALQDSSNVSADPNASVLTLLNGSNNKGGVVNIDLTGLNLTV